MIVRMRRRKRWIMGRWACGGFAIRGCNFCRADDVEIGDRAAK